MTSEAKELTIRPLITSMSLSRSSGNGELEITADAGLYTDQGVCIATLNINHGYSKPLKIEWSSHVVDALIELEQHVQRDLNEALLKRADEST